MTDHLTRAQRSANMSAVRGRNTQPELVVRRLAHSLGYRFRLHRRDLPGCPDLVFPARHKVIFVHGCFWHQHEGCKRASLPQTRSAFWRKKLRGNIARDAEAVAHLNGQGWGVLTVWECQIKDLKVLRKRLRSFLR